MLPRAVRAPLVFFGLPIAVCSCAAIWGFQDAVDLRDGGGVDAGGASDAPHAPDGTILPGPKPGTACVPAAPAGWQGPLILFEAQGTAPPDCLAGFTLADDGKADLSGDPAVCGCTCGSPTGVTCAPPTINFFSDPNCNNPCGQKDQAMQTTCSPLNLAGCSGTHFRLSPAPPTGGSCTPSPSKAIPQLSAKNVRVCAPTPDATSGCPTGMVITPATGLPFAPETYCIARAGEQGCNWPSYPVNRTYYKTVIDTRDCSACSCGAPSGGSCSGGGVTFGDNNCTTGITSAAATPQICSNGPKATGYYDAGTVSGATSCLPSSAQPIGAVAGQDSTTLCCTQ